AVYRGAAGVAGLGEVGTGRLICPLAPVPLSATFSPDGKLLLLGYGDGTARLVETATGQTLGHPFCHEEEVLLAAFSPDGSRFVTGSGCSRFWGSAGGARLWETPRRPPPHPTLAHARPVR